MNWAAIAAIGTIVAALLGTAVNLAITSHGHGRTEGMVSQALKGIDERLNRYETAVAVEQQNQWTAMTDLRVTVKDHEGRIGWLEGKVNGKSHAAAAHD